MGPLATPGRRRTTWTAIALVALLFAALMPAPSGAQEEVERIDHPPIRLVGNEELDAFFAGAGTDGLTPETAHVLEGLNIADADELGACLYLENTTRHVIVRDCRFQDHLEGTDAVGLELQSCSNVSMVGCEFPGTRRAVLAYGCSHITVTANQMANQSYMGVILERTSFASVTENEMENCNESMVVYRGDNVTVEGNRVCRSKVGIRVTASRDCVVFGNEVWQSSDGGIKVQRSRGNVLVEANDVHNNLLAGIHVSNSEDVEVLANEVDYNYQGIYAFDVEECFIANNNVTRGAVVGIRLTNSKDNRVEANDIKSNWAYGIDLSGSSFNTVSENRVVSHQRGIRLDRSTNNVIESNRLYNNWWVGIDGDLSENTIRNNDERANSWARALVGLILVLIILGAGVGTYRWAMRRRRSKEEEDQVLIRRRFPAGPKGLWPMSRILWDEDFFKAQLATAGPQREEILRRYSENINAAKQMQYFAVGTMSVMLAFMAALPLTGLLNVVTVDVTADNVNDVLLASVMSISVYYLMTFMILLVFGLLFTAQLMRGEIFKLLATLPIRERDSRRMVLYLLFRMYGAPLVVVLLAFPVGGLLLTWSPLFFVTALVVNGLYLVFVSYLLVLVAEATGRRVFSAKASKGATAMRFLIMGGYLISMMMLFATMQFFVRYVSDLFVAAKEAGGSGEVVNMVTSLVPFPFSGSYILSMTLVPVEHISAGLAVTTMVGILLMVAGVLVVRRRANLMLNRAARGVEPIAGGPGQVATAEDVVVLTRLPMPAFLRNGLLVTSRDQGAVLYIIMPLLFPLVALVPMAAEGGQMTAFDAIVPFLMYMGIMPFMVNMALSSGDASVGGLLGSLPFRVLDQYRAKWCTIALITSLPVAIITLVMVSNVTEPLEMTAVLVSLVPLLMVMASMYLVTFSLAFGTVNGKQTFFMSNIRNKFGKYVGIIALQYTIVIVELAGFYLLTGAGIVSFWTGIAGLWAVNISLFLLLEVLARRVFS